MHGLSKLIRGSPSNSSTGTNAAPGSSVQDRPPEGADPDEVEVLDDEPRNILVAMASQLRPGMDLSRISLPVFVLEPRSMLEVSPSLFNLIETRSLAKAQNQTRPNVSLPFSNVSSLGGTFDPKVCPVFLDVNLKLRRLVDKGVKKPYNPILGEIFRCRYDYPDGTKGYYVAEQVCHHPPISAFYYVSVDHKVIIRGELRPKSKFLGNSAATIMEGANRVAFLDRQEDGEYIITMPNMYARGILFGKMILELGDECSVKNKQTDHVGKIDFKTKGWISGEYNAIHGKIKTDGETIAELNGKWTDSIEIKRNHGKPVTLFDTVDSKITPKTVAKESDQLENESRRLWSKVTSAIASKNLDAATEAKAAIEDAQREAASRREANHETWSPKYFKFVDDQYIPNFVLPDDPSQADAAISKWIWAESPQPPTAAGAAPSTASPQQPTKT